MDKRCCETDYAGRPTLVCAPPQYADLRARVQWELDDKGTNPFGRRPILVGLDGRSGAGKSTIAAWLAWQFQMPAVHLDMFMKDTEGLLTWRTDDLRRVLDSRLKNSRPVIVEGICLLEVLQAAGHAPDFLIFVRQFGNTGGHYLNAEIGPYFRKWRPQKRADYMLTWRA